MLGSTDPICHEFILGSTMLFQAPQQLFKKTTQSVLWAIFSLEENVEKEAQRKGFQT